MSTTIFILGLIFSGSILYLYLSKQWQKREQEFDKFAYKMQKDFLDSSIPMHTGIDYYKQVESFFKDKGYDLCKHTSFPTDYIAKKDKEVMFIRIQAPQDKQSITAQTLQSFIGQTVLETLDDKEHTIRWTYVCSKMMCDKSAKILLRAYETKVKFERIETTKPK